MRGKRITKACIIGVNSAKTAGRMLWTELCEDIARPVLKMAITSGLCWVAGRAYNRITRKNGVSGNGMADILGLVKRRALETVTDKVVSHLVDGKEDGDVGGGDVERTIRRTVGTRNYSSRGDDFLPWKRSIMRVMLHRFWHDPAVPLKLGAVCGPDGSGDANSIPVQTGYDESEIVWEGCMISGHYRGMPVCVRFTSTEEKLIGGLVWYAKEHSLVERLQREFATYLIEKNYLKGQALDSNGELMDVDRCPTWSDVVLPTALKESVQKHTLGFLGHLDELTKKGVATSRGNLWVGPPGTGKTTVGRILARQAYGKATFLAIHAPNLAKNYHESNEMSEVFRMARSLRPTILLLDDLDKAESRIPKSLLGELDGTIDNDGIVVIATVNNLGALDLGLRDRPKRFDMVTEFKLPDREARKDLFDLFLWGLKVEIDVDTLAADSEGLSPAHCKEVVERAVIEGQCSTTGPSLAEGIIGSLQEVLAQHRLVTAATEDTTEDAPETEDGPEIARNR